VNIAAQNNHCYFALTARRVLKHEQVIQYTVCFGRVCFRTPRILDVVGDVSKIVIEPFGGVFQNILFLIRKE